MRRTLAASLLLSLLLVVAGCNGTGGQATAGTNVTSATVTTESGQPATGSGTQATGTATATPPATDPVYATPLNISRVLGGHSDALGAGITFRYVQNATVTQQRRGGLLQLTNVTATVNLSSNALLVRQNVSLQGTSVIYRNESAFAYERRVRDGQVSYQDPNPRAINSTFYRQPPISRYLRGLAYTYRGTTNVDGERVYRYTVTDRSQLTPDEHGLGVIPPENVRTIESELLITERGVVRSFAYSVTGNNSQGDPLRYRLSLSYDQVGSTTVRAPSWLSAAREAG